MCKKLIFRVRIRLMKWDMKSASGDTVIFVFLISHVIFMSISVLAAIFGLPWLFIVTSILFLVLVFIHLIIGNYCQGVIRSMSKLTTRVKILVVVCYTLLVLLIILIIRFLLATLV